MKKKILDPEKVYLRSQILERPSIGEYWNISSVPVLPENVIFTFFRTCWCYSEASNSGTQKWSSIVQYLCTSIWDLKYTFSLDPPVRGGGVGGEGEEGAEVLHGTIGTYKKPKMKILIMY